MKAHKLEVNKEVRKVKAGGLGVPFPAGALGGTKSQVKCDITLIVSKCGHLDNGFKIHPRPSGKP
jgi:hypothetical protein